MSWQWCVCGRTEQNGTRHVGNPTMKDNILRRYSVIETQSTWQWWIIQINLYGWQNAVAIVWMSVCPPSTISEHLLYCGLHGIVPLYRIPVTLKILVPMARIGLTTLILLCRLSESRLFLSICLNLEAETWYLTWDAEQINATIWWVSSNVILNEYQEWWFEVLLGMLDNHRS